MAEEVLLLPCHPQCPRQFLSENRDLFRTTDADADAAVEGGGHGLADEDAAVGEGLEHGHGEGAVAAAIDGDEVGGRGDWRQAVVAGDGGDGVAACSDVGESGLQVGLVRQSGECGDLGLAVDPEMVAHLVEGADGLGFADGVAAAQAGQTVGLREGAEAQDIWAGDVQRRQRAGGRGFAIGLIEQQERRAAQQRPGGGSNFTIRLPLASAEPSSLA